MTPRDDFAGFDEWPPEVPLTPVQPRSAALVPYLPVPTPVELVAPLWVREWSRVRALFSRSRS